MKEKKEKSEKEKSSQKANEIRAEIMLEELKLKYPIFNNNNLNDDFIIKKIIELNFNENKIKENCDANKIYQELEDDFFISSYLEEETVINKIIELNFDKEEIIEWVSDEIMRLKEGY